MRGARILIVLFLLPLLAFANMASPIKEGTTVANPFLNQHVDILHENIRIVPDKDFETALFQIEYHIRSDQDGVNIPLLFYAWDFKDHFKVWVDGSAVELKEIPQNYQDLDGTPFEDFDYFFDVGSSSNTKQVTIYDRPWGGFIVTIDYLKYFETNLTKGEHLIKVEYQAKKWTDKSDWIKEYSFRYILSPAKYWRSFGTLQITLDGSHCDKRLATNLGIPKEGDPGQFATWSFSELPMEVLKVSYTPQVGILANVLISLTPIGICLICSATLMLLHWLFLRNSRSKVSEKAYWWLRLLSSLTVSFLFFVGYIYAYALIEQIIGPEFGGQFGYIFLIIVFYPVVAPLYWLVITALDRKAN